MAPLSVASTGADFKRTHYQDFRTHGLSAEHRDLMAGRLDRYRSVVPGLPRRYAPLGAGDRPTLGALDAGMLVHAGHSPAQTLLHVPARDLLFAADHVLAQISPDVSVAEDKPEDDPLGRHVASLADLPTWVPDRTLVLAGHRPPFVGLHRRCADLITRHAAHGAEIAPRRDAATG